MLIDVFERLKTPKPVVGGVLLKVVSPKGIREFREETQRYHYKLHTQTILIFDDRQDNVDKPVDIGEGLYWVVAICRSKDLGLHWNHYIFKANDEGKTKVLGKYFNQMDSSWIVEALPEIKRYFKKK